MSSSTSGTLAPDILHGFGIYMYVKMVMCVRVCVRVCFVTGTVDSSPAPSQENEEEFT
jgi:hypothetical protein